LKKNKKRIKKNKKKSIMSQSSRSRIPSNEFKVPIPKPIKILEERKKIWNQLVEEFENTVENSPTDAQELLVAIENEWEWWQNEFNKNPQIYNISLNDITEGYYTLALYSRQLANILGEDIEMKTNTLSSLENLRGVYIVARNYFLMWLKFLEQSDDAFIFDDIFQKRLCELNTNIIFWDNYILEYLNKSIDEKNFNVYKDIIISDYLEMKNIFTNSENMMTIFQQQEMTGETKLDNLKCEITILSLLWQSIFLIARKLQDTIKSFDATRKKLEKIFIYYEQNSININFESKEENENDSDNINVRQTMESEKNKIFNKLQLLKERQNLDRKRLEQLNGQLKQYAKSIITDFKEYSILKRELLLLSSRNNNDDNHLPLSLPSPTEIIDDIPEFKFILTDIQEFL
jgi:hypothetical protein